MESDVRTHRMFSPNRRPLLISALLVALTSVPTFIVVAAGSASLNTAPSVRAPIVAEPRPGPFVVDPTPGSGLHRSEVPSPATEPTAPLPPVSGGKWHASKKASGGSGGGFSVGTTSKAPRSVPAPKVQKPSETVPVIITPHAPPAVKPPAVKPPAVKPPAGIPIQDKAWPGWDGKMKGRPEVVNQPGEHPSRKGSADQSDSADYPLDDVQL